MENQGGGKWLQNYHLVGKNCFLLGDNVFEPPDLVGKNISLLKIDDTPKGEEVKGYAEKIIWIE